MALAKQWTNLFGTPSLDWARSIATASDGSIYLAGSTHVNLDGKFVSDASNGFVVKYKSDGTKAWSQSIDTSSWNRADSITTASDGSVYVAGCTQEINSDTDSKDAYIAKYNSDGTRAWKQLLGTSSWDSATSITTASDGSIYLTGITSGNLDGQSNSGNLDVFITKYSSDGSKAWTQLLGSSSDDIVQSITLANDGSIYIAGRTDGSLDGQSNNGGSDIFIAKYSSLGSKVWTQLFGSSGFEEAQSIATAMDGSIYLTGDTRSNDGSNVDSFVIKCDGNGTIEWFQSIGTTSVDWAYSITADKGGAIYVAGSTEGNLDEQINSGNGDAFLSKYESNGSRVWTQLLGTSSRDNGLSVTIANDGSIYYAGSTEGNLDGQVNSGREDAFLVKFSIGSAPNLAPKGITATATKFNENITAGSVVANLNSTDPDAGNTFTYALVAGAGSTDNAAFTISGNQLKINASPNFESKSSYSVRVQTKDQGGLTFEKNLIFKVNNINEAPIGITATATKFNENITAESVVANLNSTDPDAGNTFTYALVAGAGSTDNAAFTISGNQLKINASPNFESKSSYSVRVQTKDQGGLTFEKSFTFGVNDLIEKVTSSASTVLAPDKDILELTGSKNIFGTGNDRDNTITGNSGRNRITGGLGKDILTGGLGQDVFFYAGRNESLLGHFDVIKDFSAGETIACGFDVEGDAIIAPRGIIDSLIESSIKGLLTETVFEANSVDAFKVIGISGCFVAINDSSNGFQAGTDSIIYLLNYEINGSNPVVVF